MSYDMETNNTSRKLLKSENLRLEARITILMQILMQMIANLERENASLHERLEAVTIDDWE